jgi:hypothetical protein
MDILFDEMGFTQVVFKGENFGVRSYEAYDQFSGRYISIKVHSDGKTYIE